jgi:hypothetical protein
LNGEYQVQAYDDFSDNQKYDIIINFVGIGDPEKAQKMGGDIFKITEKYDDMVLESHYIGNQKSSIHILCMAKIVKHPDINNRKIKQRSMFSLCMQLSQCIPIS